MSDERNCLLRQFPSGEMAGYAVFGDIPPRLVRSSVIALGLLAGLASIIIATMSTSAFAACETTGPTTDQTITCNTSPPNPETAGIFIADNSNVKGDILPGAILETTGGPAITIGTPGASSGSITVNQFDNQGIVRTIGNNSPAILVVPDPAPDFGDFTLVLTDTHFGMVETSGDDSPALVYGEFGGGVGTDGSFISFDISATIATVGDRSPGLVSGGIGIGAGQMSDAFIGMAGHTYSVDTQGHDSPGVIFNALGDTSGTQEMVIIDVEFTADTVGDRSPGVIFGANRTTTPNTLISSFQASDIGAFVTTQGDDSVGFFFGPGARPSGDFTVAFVSIGGHVVTSGDYSHGIIYTEGLSNAMLDQSVRITATNLNGSATTSGNNSHGIILGDGLGTTRTDMDYISSMDIGDGLSATTSGANSHALVLSELTTLTLDVANSDATTANGTIVTGFIDSFDTFVATGVGSRAVMNHGILYGTFTVGDLIVGNLGNNGLIESAEGAGGVAVLFTGTTDDTFELQTQGVVIGSVEAGLGTDTFILGGSGTKTFDVELIGTQFNGFEEFEKTGSSTWTLEGSNSVAGPFLVSDGVLIQNAALENLLVTVGANGTLGGTGSIAGLVMTSGGIVTPGNSIGTLTVVGNADFANGSTYVVEINSGGNTPGINNDRIVADTATIADGAIFRITPENGTDTGMGYAPSTVYTIITTADLGPATLTVAGAGPTIEDDFAFIDFSGSYDDENYYVTSSAVAASFCLPGASFNQCQAGEAVRDLGTGNPAYDAVVGMSEANVNAAFDALSGEVHASGQHIIDQTFALFSGALSRKGTPGQFGTDTADALLGYSVVSRRGPGVVAIDAATDTFDTTYPDHFWLMPLGGRGKVRADGNAAQLDWAAGGLAAGYETAVETAQGSALAGVAFGYIRSHGAVPARQSTLDADGVYAGIYGDWSGGPWSVSGSMSVAANHISTERRISFGAIDETASASYWSQAVRLAGEMAYTFELDGGTSVSPLFTLDAGWSGHDGFIETGAGALNLTGAAETWTRFDAGIGVALTHVALTEHGEVTVDGRLVWEHAFADVVPSQTLVFAGRPTGFEVRGPDAGRDRLRLGLGVSLQATDDISVRAGYEGVFSDNQNSHAVRVGFNVKF